jgi:hypothetical protein
MSALLGHNPIKYTSWKGAVVHQITSSIQKNASTQGATDFENYRRAMPLKIYRREIAVNIPSTDSKTKCVHSRVSSSIDELNRPNGSIVVPINVAGNKGLENVLEYPTPSSKNETGQCIDAASSANCAAINARKRVRSSGMIRKKLDPATGDNTYFTNTSQYLTSRSRTYNQNLYHHVRYTDTLLNAPINQTKTNIYISNGISHCPKTQIVAGANTFQYYWFDASGLVGTNTAYTVTITPGYYDLDGLNGEVHRSMELNQHFIYNKITNSRVFLLNFAYNSETRQIELQLFSSSNYQNPLMYLPPYGVSWTIVDNRVVTVEFPSTGIQSVLGFSAGQYPPLSAGNIDNISATNIPYNNNLAHSINPSYMPITYKPSNARFAQQGGVSSGSMTDRKKYETITTTATTYIAPFGKQVANALAYGVKETTYTIKDKMGFPNKRTPVVCGTTVKCNSR